MEQKLKKTGNTGKWLLFLVVIFQGMGATLFAQKPMVTLSINDKKVAPDAPVTVTVTTNLSGTISVDYPLEYAVDYGLMNGMKQQLDPSTGKIQTLYYMQQGGTFRKAGTYSFYAYVKYKGRTFRSNQLTVKVDEDEETEEDDLGYNSKDPIFGVIQSTKTTVYEGEPVMLKAKVFSELEIYFLEGYMPFKADKNAEDHVFQNQKYVVEPSRYNGRNVLTFEYGKQLLFPIVTGKCRIQPFEMSLRCHGSIFDKTVTFRSSSTTLNVKPLPDGAPKDFIGAVGTYTLSQEPGKTKMRQGDVFTLKLTVHGTGNLHNTNAPVLHLPGGCSIYGDPERKENYTFTEEGADGEISYLYNIQVMNSGNLHFAAPSISYFDPQAETYVTVRGKAFTLDVEEDQSFQPIVDNSHNQPKHNDLDIDSAAPAAKKEKNRSAVFVVVGVVTPICLLGFLFLFMKQRKRKEDEQPAAPVKFAAAERPAAWIPEKEAAPDYWALAVESQDDACKFAVLLPKAIIQQLEKRLKYECYSREKAFSQLNDQYPEQAAALHAIIERCDQSRYGICEVDLDPKAVLAETKAILDTI